MDNVINLGELKEIKNDTDFVFDAIKQRCMVEINGEKHVDMFNMITIIIGLTIWASQICRGDIQIMNMVKTELNNIIKTL